MATSRFALLELRVAALEAEIKQINQQPALSKAEDWVDRMYGLFADYPDFDQVVELGRQYRESLRPKPGKRKSKKQQVA